MYPTMTTLLAFVRPSLHDTMQANYVWPCCVAVFLGGAVLADIMKDKPSFWVSKQEYEEDPYRALKKCGSL